MRIGASRLDPASGMSPSRLNGVANVALVAGDDVIAMQQHGGADADRKAADRGDQRFLIARERMEKFHGLRPQPAALRRFEKFGDIGAGAERVGPAGDHDATDGLARRGFVQRGRHRHIHRLRQRVLLLRTVHADDPHGAVVGHHDLIGHIAPVFIFAAFWARNGNSGSAAAGGRDYHKVRGER